MSDVDDVLKLAGIRCIKGSLSWIGQGDRTQLQCAVCAV